MKINIIFMCFSFALNLYTSEKKHPLQVTFSLLIPLLIIKIITKQELIIIVIKKHKYFR